MIAIAQEVNRGYRSIIHFINCEYKLTDAAPRVRLLGQNMLMYNHISMEDIDLFPLLEGTSVSGVIL